VQATTTRPRMTATADGEGVVSHAGSRLLADVADPPGEGMLSCLGVSGAQLLAAPQAPP
jgi:hypothetical protein